MGIIKKHRKKGKGEKLVFAPESAQHENVSAYVQELEARYGYLALQELQGLTKMRKEALKLARKRQKRGLGYRV